MLFQRMSACVVPESRAQLAPRKTSGAEVGDSWPLDAPTGSGFWHWAVYNIPADATGLPRGAGNDDAQLPTGPFAGNNDFLDTGITGSNGDYGGPCPPEGDAPHRYVFTLFAVAVDKLEVAGSVPKTGTAALYGFVLNEGIGAGLLGKATFTAKYGR